MRTHISGVGQSTVGVCVCVCAKIVVLQKVLHINTKVMNVQETCERHFKRSVCSALSTFVASN